MSKTIISPVKRWPGTVTLADPLSYPQVFAWRDAIQEAQAVEGEAEPDVFTRNSALIPGIVACVESWNLEYFPKAVTPEVFPATPPVSSSRLIAWLVEEIGKLFSEAEEIPLA